MPLHRFEAGGNTYTFPSTLGAYRDNFSNALARNTRLPGVDGGFDEYLAAPAARELGTISQAFTLQSDTKAGLDALRDAVRAMMLWGKGYLYFRPSNYPTQVERRCYCRVDNINMSRDEGFAQYWQRLTVFFSASSPIWEATGTASSEVINHSGTSTDDTVNNGGNAIALPVITIATGGSQVMTGPIYVRRIVSSQVVDEVKYEYNLGNSITLTIDAQKWQVIYDDGAEQDGYDDMFDFIHPDWLRLMPGNNTIRVVSGDAGDAATVTIEYRDTWY